ncbi:hypothetical protein ACQ4PT_013553 [Festuca glaucescens]
MAAQEGAAGMTNQVMKVRYGDVDDRNFALHGRAVPLLVGLLLLIVAFAAVCLYLCWACTRRRRRIVDLEASSSFAAVSPALTGLDADVINALPITLYSPERSTEEEQAVEAECSICISALVAGDKVKALSPCGHRFHPDCVDDWIRSHPSCPLCRTILCPATGAKPDAVAGNGSDSPASGTACLRRGQRWRRT